MMALTRSLATCYRPQNLLLAARHRFRPHDLKAPQSQWIAMSNAAPKSTMYSSSSSIAQGSTSSVPPRPPPPQFPYFAWAKLALGAILTLVIPFWDEQRRSLLWLEGEVEMVAEVVENTAEAVEKVAMATEKMAADVAESLPENGKLRGAVLFVEDVAKEVAEKARLTQDIIHKVDELKQGVEMLMDPRKERDELHE